MKSLLRPSNEKKFQLKTNLKDSIGVIHSVSIKRGKDENQKIKNAINTKSLWNEDFNIIVYFDEDSGSGPVRFLDTHSWEIGSPNANILVTSSRLKNILEKYIMPPHAFYKIKLSSGKEEMNYYLLHLFYDNKIELNYDRTAFLKLDLFTKKPSLIDNEPIFFKNYQDFLSKQEQLVTSTDFFYESEKYVYKTEYDIFWGHAYSIFIQEKVKRELEENKLEALNIVEFDKYEIAFNA